jgi:hypothetical protein
MVGVETGIVKTKACPFTGGQPLIAVNTATSSPARGDVCRAPTDIGMGAAIGQDQSSRRLIEFHPAGLA